MAQIVSTVQAMERLLAIVFDKLEGLQKRVDELQQQPAAAESKLTPTTPPPGVTLSDLDERISKAAIELRKDRVVFEATLTKQVEGLVDKLVKERMPAPAPALALAPATSVLPDDLSDISISEPAAASKPPRKATAGKK
jgi:hypothetical protein